MSDRLDILASSVSGVLINAANVQAEARGSKHRSTYWNSETRCNEIQRRDAYIGTQGVHIVKFSNTKEINVTCRGAAI